MWKVLLFAASLLTLTFSVGAQENHKPWSFYVNAGAGLQQKAKLKGIEIPESGRAYLNKRGIYSLNIETGGSKVVPNFNLGVSYSLPQDFLKGRSRISLHLGNQNISQKNYHAAGFSTDLLFGYDFLRHPHHDFSLEIGVGGYFTFNKMTYTWRGLDGEGKLIYIEGKPEQITLDLGWNNTASLSIPLRLSYEYNIKGSHWVGVYAQGRLVPKHSTFAPGYTASAGIEYRYTLGRKKQKYEKVYVSKKDIYPLYIKTETVYVHDTVYVNKHIDAESNIRILFERGDYDLSEYEIMRLERLDFSEVESVNLTGYSCSKDRKENNVKLAEKRAQKVKEFLEKRGIKVNSVISVTSEYVSPHFRSVDMHLNKIRN